MSEISSKKILVVDDEDDVRKYLSTALIDAGFSVDTAGDGLEAINYLKEGNLPDLISLDLVMPKHSGMKFYHEMRKNKEWAKIPVLIVTGHAHDDMGKVDFEQMMMSGPGVYLEKPVKPKNYIGRVCDLLGIEAPESAGQGDESDPDSLRKQLEKSLSGADPDALKRALEAIKKK